MPAGAGGMMIEPGMTFGDLVKKIYGPQASEYDYAELRAQNPFLQGVSGNSTKLDQFTGQQAVFGMMSSPDEVAKFWKGAGSPTQDQMYNRPSNSWNPFAEPGGAGGAGGGPAGAGTDAGGLDPQRQSALLLMRQTLQAWGLESLSGKLEDLLTQGFSSDTLSLALQDTPEWKTRFAGNELRKQAGIGVLSPAEYIATEDAYRQVLRSYGLPSGFYDSHDDFNGFIGGDVSPAELQSRAQVAKQQYLDAPPEYRDYWKNFGLNEGQALAAILDPNHASLADLQRQAKAVNVGGSAAEQGIAVSGGRALQLADHGVTLDQAREAYQRIAQFGSVDAQMGQRFGSDFGQQQQEDSLLLGDAAAQQRRRLLYQQEGAQFAGSGGASVQSASVGANF